MTDKVTETVTIAAEEAGLRLDRVLAAHIATLSRSRLKALILAGQVTIAARTIRDPAASVNSGDTITVTLPPPEQALPKGEAIPLNIVYEDDAIIVIDKPKGLVVHPAAGHATGTLVNALIAHCGDSLSGIGGVKRPGIVHRLDKDTTGLMVVAKTDRPTARSQSSSPKRPKGRSSAAISLWSGARRTARRAPSMRRSAATRMPATSRRCARAAARPSPIGRCWSAFLGPTASRSRACWPAPWRPAAPTRSGCIWPISATRFWATPTYGTGFKTKASRLGPQARAALEALGRQALHAYLLAIEHPETGQYPGVPLGTAGRFASFT